MTKFRSYTYDALALFSSSLAAKILGFVQVTILIRSFGAEDYGVWRTAFALPTVLAVIAELGVHSIILRDISVNRDALSRYYLPINLAKVVLCVAYVTIVNISAIVFHYPDRVKQLIMVIALGMIFSSFTQFNYAIFRGLLVFKVEAVISIINQASLCAIVLAVSIFKYSLEVVAWGFVVLEAVLFISSVWYLFHRIQFHPTKYLGISQSISLVKRSTPFLALALISSIFYEISTVMLSKLTSFEEVGIFNAAYRIIMIFILVIPTTLNTLLFPLLSKLFVESQSRFVIVVNSMFKNMCVINVPIMICMVYCSEPIIRVLFGSKFNGSVVHLQILSMAALVNICRTALVVALNASNQEKKGVLVMAAATAFSVVSNLILITIFSSLGASISCLLAECVRFIGTWFVLRNEFKGAISFQHMKVTIGLGAIMVLFVSLGAEISVGVGLLLGSGVYFILLYYSKLTTYQEMIWLLRK